MLDIGLAETAIKKPNINKEVEDESFSVEVLVLLFYHWLVRR